MASKKKEDQNLKTLRELISQPHNKQCLECHQKGPTYVDMMTCGFICTQCSGYLRGLNPPHRVKSVSMTTFTEAELDKLRNGGNEFAQQVWMSTWSHRDREPDKKDERNFRLFLQDKYERRRWYRDPSEVRRERETGSTATSPSNDNTSTSKQKTPLIQPPSLKARPRGDHQQQTRSSTSNSAQTTPTTAVAVAPAKSPAVEVSQKPKDTLNILDNDPFTPQPPPGGVSVLPQFPQNPSPFAPTSSTSQANDFGAFTSAAPQTGAVLQPLGSSSSTSLGSSSAPPSTFPTASSLMSTASSSVPQSDRYAALATLDQTLKDIKIKEDEQQQKMANPPQMGHTGFQQPGGGVSNTHGRVHPPLQKKESNPFLMGGPPITGPPKSQAGPQTGFGMGPQAGFGAGPQAGFGAGPQAGFGAGPQGSYAVGVQAGYGMPAQTGFGAAPHSHSGFVAGPQAGFGGFVSAQPIGQPQQFGAFNQPQQQGMVGQWGGAQPQWAGAQTQWGAAQNMGQFPNQQQGFPNQQQGFPGQQPGFPGQQFPGQPQMGGGMMMQQAGQIPYGNFSSAQMPIPQQQTPPQKPLPQFDWSSSPGNKPSVGVGGSSIGVATNTNSSTLGWSNNLSKPAPSSIWDQTQQKPPEPQQPVSVQPGSWSSNMFSSDSGGSQFGGGAGQGEWGQLQTGFGQTTSQTPNPFGASSSGGRNPFL